MPDSLPLVKAVDIGSGSMDHVLCPSHDAFQSGSNPLKKKKKK
jgi:hypothetical protein